MAPRFAARGARSHLREALLRETRELLDAQCRRASGRDARIRPTLAVAR